MAKDWLTGLFENKSFIDATISSVIAAEDLVTYDPVTGQIEDDGTPITGIASMTFAQMEALTSDQLLALAGLPIHISDVHNNSSGIGGSFLVRDSSPAGWAQISGPMYYATYASVPAGGSYPGWRYRVADVAAGGADIIDRGSKLRYANPVGHVLGYASNVSISSDKGTEQSVLKVYIPINDGKSLMGSIGDKLSIELHFGKSGTANVMIRGVRFGTHATLPVANNTWLDAITSPAAANITLDELISFERRGATSLKRENQAGASYNAGWSALPRLTSVAVPDMDAALQYVDLTLYMTGGTADTITCESATIRLEHCS